MLIVASLYALLIWLIFFRFKLLRWGWASGTVTVCVGVFLLMVVMSLLNYFTPSGRVAVMGRVVEVIPSVAGRVTEIHVAPNVLVKKGDPLFQIDSQPFLYDVRRLEAAVVEARDAVRQLAASREEAHANVQSLEAEVRLAQMKRRDIATLFKQKVKSKVELEKAETELASIKGKLAAAKSHEKGIIIALNSEIGGKNSKVAQIQAQLDDARWKLSETKVIAPSDGYVTGQSLAVGQRVSPLRSVLAFIEAGSNRLIGVFSQNGFGRITPGTKVVVAMASNPGRLYQSEVVEVFSGIGQGQLPASGILPSIGAIGMTREYGVRLALPEDLPPESLHLGMSGTATVFAEDAGAIGILAKILLWLRAAAHYL